MVHSTAALRWKRPKPGLSSKSKGKQRSTADGQFQSKRSGRPVKEVVWDDDSRRDFLTGFSKRKKEKAQAAKDRAEVKEREAKLAMRAELREARKAQAEENLKLAREYYGGNEGMPESAQDGEDDSETHGPEEETYENEEMTSRVVVEEMNMDGSEGEEEDDEDPNANMFAALSTTSTRQSQAKPPQPKQNFTTPNEGASPDKKKPKKFTYETKAARKMDKLKEKKVRAERADNRRSRESGAKAAGKGKKPMKKTMKKRK